MIKIENFFFSDGGTVHTSMAIVAYWDEDVISCVFYDIIFGHTQKNFIHYYGIVKMFEMIQAQVCGGKKKTKLAENMRAIRRVLISSRKCC